MSTFSSANVTDSNLSLKECTHTINNKIQLHILGVPPNKLGNWLITFTFMSVWQQTANMKHNNAVHNKYSKYASGNIADKELAIIHYRYDAKKVTVCLIYSAIYSATCQNWTIKQTIVSFCANTSDHRPAQVEADTRECRTINVLLQQIESLNLHQHVTGFSLGIMLHQIWHDLIHHFKQSVAALCYIGRAWRLWLWFQLIKLLPLFLHFGWQMPVGTSNNLSSAVKEQPKNGSTVPSTDLCII